MPKVVVIHHVERPVLGYVETLREAGLELEECHPVNGDPLPHLEDVDGLVVLGGMMSVADGADPLPEEIDLLRRAIDTGVPVIGICLGSQLLARAAGGEVRHVGRSIEWRRLAPTEAAEGDPLFGALPEPVPALHWNEDVIALPPHAVELLARAGDGAEAFRVGDAAWGVQFHPDVDGDALDSWYRDYADYMGDVDVAALKAEDRRQEPHQQRVSRALFEAFARVVAEAGSPARAPRTPVPAAEAQCAPRSIAND
jgi:GMP synthase (glutamine-hydrolysing)